MQYAKWVTVTYGTGANDYINYSITDAIVTEIAISVDTITVVFSNGANRVFNKLRLIWWDYEVLTQE